MKQFFRSLLARYMMIIFTAVSLLLLIQVGYAVLGTILVKTAEPGRQVTLDYDDIEARWHREAGQLQPPSREKVQQLFGRWEKQFPKASMFWIDAGGSLSVQVNVKSPLPAAWTPSSTAKFMKEHYGGDTFTVVSFAGADESQGFLVLDMPRSYFQPPLQTLQENYGEILMLLIIIIVVLFIVVSLLFFQGIRKRLVQLQKAMTLRDVDQLPLPITIHKRDEIGRLEQAFNKMVGELRGSKQREQAEEQLRKELIANLSHDLRTPLTKISAQVYSLAKTTAPETQQAVRVLQTSIADVDSLIENLMSYTLLMASKYKKEKKEVDIIRYVRERLASWYPVFEKEEFEMEFELVPFTQPIWSVDPVWLGRILDNLLQNVLRHASSGRYVEVTTESTAAYDAIVIGDHGGGMKQQSNQKGAGIGLSIVNMMVKGLGLDWQIDSSEEGTTIRIQKYK
ncbi:sensor histidine kinase [Ectobacillus ponti]|uniref:histidine kinase n=1 Tax=Ectobacillus ponti TaxID=2961894 RepID=A0AA41X908_9BACI|nr:HAMP domain-containing sensor histidine kinase [Ectobacillus ponti]MCP8967606.1 HAMP domain-containing histidine kinase [Ectobacillus ponti]